MPDSDEKFIVIVGNVVDGLNFVGPFDNAEDASEWAAWKIKAGDWRVVKLIPED